MLTSTFVLTYFKRNIAFGKYVLAHPFDWDDETDKVVVSKSRKRLLLHQARLAMYFVYLVFMIFHLFTGKADLQKQFLGGLFVMIHLSLFLVQWNWNAEKGVTEFINSLLAFEKTTLKGYHGQKTLQDKILELASPIIEISCYGLPLGILIILVSEPCTLPFLASMMTACSIGNSRPHMGLWIPILAFDTFMLLSSLVSTAFYGGHGLLTGIVGLLDCQHIIMGKAACRPPHGAHGKNAGQRCVRKVISTRCLTSCYMMYRKLQVIEAMLNSSFKGSIMPVVVWLAPLMEVASLFVCIKHHGSIKMPGFAFFPIVLLDSCVGTILILSFASLVNKRSEKVMQQLRKSTTLIGTRRSLITRRLASCHSLNVKFGMNFVDNATPLVVQDFCITQTASLLLLSNN